VTKYQKDAEVKRMDRREPGGTTVLHNAHTLSEGNGLHDKKIESDRGYSTSSVDEFNGCRHKHVWKLTSAENIEVLSQFMVATTSD
jgi:hypothetical protein